MPAHVASPRGSGAREEAPAVWREGTAAREPRWLRVSASGGLRKRTADASSRDGAGLPDSWGSVRNERRDAHLQGATDRGWLRQGSHSAWQRQRAPETMCETCTCCLSPGHAGICPTVSPSKAGMRSCVHVNPWKERDSVKSWKTRTGQLFDWRLCGALTWGHTGSCSALLRLGAGGRLREDSVYV